MPHPTHPVIIFNWHRRDDFFEYLVSWLNARMREELSPLWYDGAYAAAVEPLRTQLIGAKPDASQRHGAVHTPDALTADDLQEMSGFEIMVYPLLYGPWSKQRDAVLREHDRLFKAFEARLAKVAWTVDSLKSALEAVEGEQSIIHALINALTDQKVAALLKVPTDTSAK